MLRVVCVMLLLFSSSIVLNAQDRRVLAPVERNGFTALTSYDSLRAFLGSLAGSSSLHISTIATTRSGRSVFLVHYTSPGATSNDSTLRVLLFAQQHGNEPSGKEAMTILLARCASGGLNDLRAPLDLYIVPQMNPDGAELRQRRTSDSLDMNRMHLVLGTPEVEALHEVFHAVKPHVTLDVHEFFAYSESWTDSGIIKMADVQLGMLTNPNSSHALAAFQHSEVFPAVAKAMAGDGYLFQEYIVGSPSDRVRHSTTEINDGRQSFGILNTLSFIQEGREGNTLEENLERRSRSQLTGIMALLQCCTSHASEIIALLGREREALKNHVGDTFALRMQHIAGDRRLVIPVRTLSTGRDTTWLVTPYHSVVQTLSKTTLPQAYVVPKQCSSVIRLLEKHHVSFTTVQAPRTMRVDRYIIDSVDSDALEEDTLPRPHVHAVSELVTLSSGDVIVPTTQWHSFFLATLLEPESMWGLTKYPQFSWILKNPAYPILRVP